MCPVEGTEVFTDEGLKLIEALRVGDRLLTHRGRFRAVTRVASYIVNEVASLKAKTLEQLRLAASDRVMAMSVRYQKRVLFVGWHRLSDLLVRPVIDRERGREAANCPHTAICLPIIEPEEEVSDVCVSDFYCLKLARRAGYGKMAKWWKVIRDGERFRLSHAKSKWVIDQQKLHYPFGRLMGLYLAEGCVSSRGVVWSFHREEKYLINEVQHLVSERFGLGVHMRTQGNCTTVAAWSSLLKGFFCSVGKGAHTKRIASWMWSAPLEFHRGLIDGWRDGDAYQCRNIVDGITVSKSLAWGLRVLLMRFGLHASIHCIHRIQSRRPAFRVVWRLGGKDCCVWDKNFAAYSLQKLDVVKQNARMFAIKVADDESFVTTGGTVHNCHFPNSEHDDIVDSLTILLKRLMGEISAEVWLGRGEHAEPERPGIRVREPVAAGLKSVDEMTDEELEAEIAARTKPRQSLLASEPARQMDVFDRQVW